MTFHSEILTLTVLGETALPRPSQLLKIANDMPARINSECAYQFQEALTVWSPAATSVLIALGQMSHTTQVCHTPEPMLFQGTLHGCALLLRPMDDHLRLSSDLFAPPHQNNLNTSN